MHSNDKCREQFICMYLKFPCKPCELQGWAHALWKTCQGRVFRTEVNLFHSYALSLELRAERKDSAGVCEPMFHYRNSWESINHSCLFADIQHKKCTGWLWAWGYTGVIVKRTVEETHCAERRSESYSITVAELRQKDKHTVANMAVWNSPGLTAITYAKSAAFPSIFSHFHSSACHRNMQNRPAAANAELLVSVSSHTHTHTSAQHYLPQGLCPKCKND